MKKNKTPLSGAASYKQLGEFWDDHDLSEYFEQTRVADFEVKIDAEISYYALEKNASEKIHELAHRKGVSADTLLNMWVIEKIKEEYKRLPA